MKPPVVWMTAPPGFNSNFYGYSMMIRRLQEHVAEHVDLRDGVRDLGATGTPAQLALAIVAPFGFLFPAPHMRNVLFTMSESRDLPRVAVEGVQRADALVVPSRFCERAFARYVRPGTPIYRVPLGVELLPYTRRDPRTKAFRWLWNGALNARKGWSIAADTWNKYFRSRTDMELYVKSTLPENHPHAGTTRWEDNVFFDFRNLSWEAMQRLYASAHAFMLPSIGEGWGQTLAEAMSSGMPCVATRATGYLDFANDRNSYLVPATRERVAASHAALKETEDGKYEWHLIDRERFAVTIERVQREYGNALVKARRGVRDVRRLTWQASAAQLGAVLRQEAEAAAAQAAA